MQQRVPNIQYRNETENVLARHKPSSFIASFGKTLIMGSGYHTVGRAAGWGL